MENKSPGEVTLLLAAAAEGNRSAIDQIYVLLYPELRKLARQRAGRSDSAGSLDTTSVVHESYLRLIKVGKIAAPDRNHFLAYAAHVMRSVVIDFVRRARAQRRGGQGRQVTLDSNVLGSLATSEDEIVHLNDLLNELEKLDARLVSVVELRYFAGLDAEQIAECLGVTRRTVDRDLKKVRLLMVDTPKGQ